MSDSKPVPESATISLADEEGVRRILVEAMISLRNTVDHLSRLRPGKRERYRLALFGSARTHPGHWVYAEVKRMAGEFAAIRADSAGWQRRRAGAG